MRARRFGKIFNLPTVMAITISATLMTPPAEARLASPRLRLIAAANDITLYKYEGTPWIYPDFGLYVAAEGSPFEVRVNRKSYREPIVAKQVIKTRGKSKARNLPSGLVRKFNGFPRFFRIAFTNAQGERVLDRSLTFCPNGYEVVRVQRKAASEFPYPVFCSANPFTLGGVWGIQEGWAVNTLSPTGDPPISLPEGKYTARVTVTKQYRELFGIRDGEKTLKVTVRTAADRYRALREPPGKIAKHSSMPPVGLSQLAGGPRPDLRALPAFDIELLRASTPAGVPAHDHLVFSSTVWNAGPGVMVVDGFRRRDNALMDAYQYFYNAKGKQVGYTRAGSFEWDPRPGHEHWHFTDFVSYDLVDASSKQVIKGHKESFCLASTDAIDYTIKNAKWQPENTNLHTSCGRPTSLSIRQVLDVGSGDTYGSILPGQSFDVTNLPNGSYFIRLTANPFRRLTEANPSNNTSFRKIILGGRPGKRTLKVLPLGLIKQ